MYTRSTTCTVMRGAEYFFHRVIKCQRMDLSANENTVLRKNLKNQVDADYFFGIIKESQQIEE